MKEETEGKPRSVSFVEHVLLGVDIGGSHIGCGFVREKKVLIWYETTVDPFTLDEQGLLSSICNLVFRLKNDFESGSPINIQAVGVGCPGQCKDGVFIRASNLPRIFKCNLATAIHSHLDLSSDVPVVLLNDADAAVAAEVWGTNFMETHPTAKNIAMITIGTGIGVEVAPLDVFGLNTPSSDKNKAVINGAKEVFQRAQNGDQVAQVVLNETYECLAILCINLCRIIDPDVIIIGGGMALAGDVLLSSVKDYFVRRSWSVMKDSVVLVLGSNATQAGIIGAAMAAKNELECKNVGIKPTAASSSSSSSSLTATDGFSIPEQSSVQNELEINPYSGLLIMSVGVNVAVAASLLGNGKKNVGMLELAQGSLLLLSQLGLGIWLFSQKKR